MVVVEIVFGHAPFGGQEDQHGFFIEAGSGQRGIVVAYKRIQVFCQQVVAEQIIQGHLVGTIGPQQDPEGNLSLVHAVNQVQLRQQVPFFCNPELISRIPVAGETLPCPLAVSAHIVQDPQVFGGRFQITGNQIAFGQTAQVPGTGVCRGEEHAQHGIPFG